MRISLENLDRKRNNAKLETTPQGLGSLLHLKEKIVASIKNIEADQNKDEWWSEEYKEFDNLQGHMVHIWRVSIIPNWIM